MIQTLGRPEEYFFRELRSCLTMEFCSIFSLLMSKPGLRQRRRNAEWSCNLVVTFLFFWWLRGSENQGGDGLMEKALDFVLHGIDHKIVLF